MIVLLLQVSNKLNKQGQRYLHLVTDIPVCRPKSKKGRGIHHLLHGTRLPKRLEHIPESFHVHLHEEQNP